MPTTLQDLPAINATLNAISTFFILIGLISIKRDQKKLHIAAMAAAMITSTLFLTCYLIYHFNVTAVTRFTHPGWPRTLYFFILGTHVPLAALSVPLIAMTVIPALRARYDKHRRWAKITAPIWLYVSVTGVLVYLMLYVWFPPVK